MTKKSTSKSKTTTIQGPIRAKGVISEAEYKKMMAKKTTKKK